MADEANYHQNQQQEQQPPRSRWALAGSRSRAIWVGITVAVLGIAAILAGVLLASRKAPRTSSSHPQIITKSSTLGDSSVPVFAGTADDIIADSGNRGKDGFSQKPAAPTTSIGTIQVATDASKQQQAAVDGNQTILPFSANWAGPKNIPPNIGIALNAALPPTNLPTAACYAATWQEVSDAIMKNGCNYVKLTSKYYEVDDEIKVTTRVTVMGDINDMPVIDAEHTARAFRILDGGFLEARFMTFVMSEGVYRPALPFEGVIGDTVLEIKGSSALFEASASGGLFVGCYFLDDPDPQEGLESAIESSLKMDQMRMYGGFVFVAAGEVDFVGCLFWDLSILYPMTNMIYIGEDVLCLGGVITFTGCSFWENTVFGPENGIGIFVANLGGATFFNFCVVTENYLVVNENAIGQAMFQGAGLMVTLGCAIQEFAVILMYSGTGYSAVVGGIMLNVGIGNEEIFAVGAVFGVGMEYMVGAGIMINVGTSLLEYQAVYATASLGEINFVGTGIMIMTGAVTEEWLAVVSEFGQGAVAYNGAGYVQFIGCTLIDSIAMGDVFLVGEQISVQAGLTVFYGSMIIEWAAIEFYRGMGSVIFVAAGGLVLGRGLLIEIYSPMVSRSVEYWIMGSCETEGNEGGGEAGGEAGGETGAETSEAGTEQGGERSLGLELYTAPKEEKRGLYTMPVFTTKGSAPCAKWGQVWTRWQTHNFRKPLPESEPVAEQHEEVEEAEMTVEGESGAVVEGESGASSLAIGGERWRKLRMIWATPLSSENGPTSHLPPPVRRQVTALPFDEAANRMDRNPSNLLAWDIERRTSLDGLDTSRYFGAETVRKLDKMQDKMALFEGGGEDEDYRPAFHINTPLEGYCGMCNVPGVEGAGASSCVYHDDCNHSEVKALGRSYVGYQDNEEAAPEAMANLKYDEHYIIMGSMNPTTSSDIDELDREMLQESFVAALAHMQGQDREPVMVNLWSGAPDPFFGFMQPAPTRSLLETEMHDKTHHWKFGLLSTSKDTNKLLHDILDEQVDQDGYLLENTFAEHMRVAFKQNTGIELGSVGLTSDKEYFVPKYNSKEITSRKHRHLGTHSTLLVDPDQAAIPVVHVKYNKKYNLHLENFPPATTFNLELRSLKYGSPDQVVVPVDSVTINEYGEAKVDYAFDRTVPPGEYYFEIALDGGMLSQSMAYTLSQQGHQRRNYGPLLRF